MISLRNYILGDANQEAETTYRRVIELMMQGISLHAVQGEHSDYEHFRAHIDELSAILTGEVAPAELLAAATRVVSALREYNYSTNVFVRRQNAELHNMVSMLTQTIIKIGANSDQSVARLREIGKALAQAHVIKDIEVLKERLGQCLETVRDEAERQKMQSQNAVARLEMELDSVRTRIGSVAEVKEDDAVTGLPGAAEAEQGLRVAVGSPEGRFVMVAVVNRVHAVNARFGYTVGDRILKTWALHLRGGLQPSDQLYRWRGPVFVAILTRQARIDDVRGEVGHFADARLEETVEVGNRSVLIPVSSNWSVMAIAPPFETLRKKIEAFATAQIPREYA